MTMSALGLGPIEEVAWGKYVIKGVEHSTGGTEKKGFGKDIRIIGEKVSEWHERHEHQLRPEMITGIYEQGIQILVIGTGHDGAMKVNDETIESIRKHGIQEIIIEKTPGACRKYNEYFVKGYQVAMLSHGTC